jgi:toxin-antitoxin system PIN domain toxin
MKSIDTNILFYALNEDAPLHTAAIAFMQAMQDDDEFALAEFVLAELYRLLRNPVVLTHPLSASEAAGVIQQMRHHPRWKVLGFPTESQSLHDKLWGMAARRNFPYRRLYDARLALILMQHGVTEFATVNTKDFLDLGFERVWNPLEAGR